MYNRIAIIMALFCALVTISSCGRPERFEDADRFREQMSDLMQGIRDGFYDSTVVVMINDTVASAADAEMVASTISMTTTGDHAQGKGAGITTININLPDNSFDNDFDDMVPSFVSPVAILGVIMIFGGPIIAVFFICYFIYRTKKARYQALSEIVASGREVPKELFPQVDPRAKWNSGIKYVAWGAGLMLFFLLGFDIEWAALMFVPIIIGVGKLISYRQEQRLRETQSLESDPVDENVNNPKFPPIPPRR